MRTQLADDARATIAVLKRDGWQQGSYFDPKYRTRGPCCQAGAALRAIDRRAMTSAALSQAGMHRWDALQAAMTHEVSITENAPWPSAIYWNDMPGRTVDQVIVALEAVIARVESW